MNVQRYTWEDALLEAESKGLLQAGAVNLGLRLASAITWHTKGNKPSGLYWKNESALRKVGSSRATYFRYRAELFSAGFFTEEKGNLIPLVPDLSQIETNESQVETELSQVETAQSQVDTPYSVDTYPVDVSTVDTSSEEAPVSADASPVSSNYENEGTSMYSFKYVGNPDHSNSLDAGPQPVYVVDLSGVTRTPQSQIETVSKRMLTPGEKSTFENTARGLHATPEQTAEALAIVLGTTGPFEIFEATQAAFAAVGLLEKEAVW